LLAGAPCRFRVIDPRTVLVIAAARAPAAPPPPNEPRPPSLVSEVVVTATKRPAALDRLPAGVSALSREQIALTGAVDVGQTVGQLAGVLSTNLGPGRDKLLIRGLSDGAFTGRARSTVSTYLDDVPINDNAPDPDLRLVDVDRIEVVRGPQGALYGSGAVSGIYRIVTRKPDLTKAAAGVAGALAWTDDGDPSHEVEGYLSLPLIAGRAALRLAAYEDRQGGYLDDVNLRISDVDQTRRDGGRLALRVQVNDAWRLDLLAAAQHLRSNDTQYVTPAMGRGQRANRIREAHNNDFTFGSGAVQGDFDWGSVSSTVAYVHHVFSSQYDASGTEALDFFGAARPNLGVYEEATRVNMLVQDLVLRSSGAGRFDWLMGLYVSRTIERTPSTLGILSAGPSVQTVYDEDRKDRLGEYALYGEATYDLPAGWSATLGGRVFETRVHTTAVIDVRQPNGRRSFDQARRFQGFSPKLSLQREFQNGDLVYGLISEGYRPGGFNSSGFLPIPAPRTVFTRDRLRNYELGAKFRRFEGRLSVRVAGFYDDWVNIQTDRPRASGLSYTANVADADIYGLEGEVSYDWPLGLSIQLNGLVSDSRVKNPNPDFRAPIAGDLPGVPHVSGGMLAVYQRPMPGGLTLKLVAEASYVGRSALSFDASQPARQGHYLRAKFSAEVARDVWRASAFVSNPFNDTGDTFAYGNPFSFSGASQVRQVTPQRPRTIGVRIAAEF
jgi:outer membrane receptor protein involved in Fe transport